MSVERVELRRVYVFHQLDRGTWLQHEASISGAIWIACGDCGARAALTDDHVVDDDGNVSPSLTCPVECGWRVFARLLGKERRNEAR